MYTSEQVRRYLEHIGYPNLNYPCPGLDFLTELQKRQLARVPFETLSLHYSRHRLVSLEYEDLFEKIVIKGRGGYCVENNSFFGHMLRSLGFELIGVGCRVSHATRGILDGGWRGMSHMANLVMIDNVRYLVDVGFGADGPCQPLRLQSGVVSEGLPGQNLMLEHKNLSQHSDPSQRVWVYSHQRGSKSWVETYCFAETEFFAADFEVLNHITMTSPRSFFAQNIVVQRFLLDEAEGKQSMTGVLLLFRDRINSRTGESEETLQVLENEDQRIQAFKNFFSISLADHERRAIQGLASELKK